MKKTISIILALFIIVSGILVSSANSFASDSKAVSGAFNYTYVAEVLTLVNKERRANGLKEVTLTKSLTDSAMIRSAETTLSFSHTRPNGEQCFTAFEWTSAAGENIAYGQRSPEQVMEGWMNSSGHRANILNSSFTTIGIGCFEYAGRLYWAQAFSGGKGTAYNPSGKINVSVEVSLKPGVQSKLVSTQELPVTTEKQTTKITTAKTTTKINTTSTIKTTTKATTKATTKPSVSSSAKATTKPSTTKKQIVITNRRTIFDLINSIIERYFKL